MRILIDTDVTLDFLLMRQPFSHEAREIFKACAQSRIVGHIAAITPVNIFYIARKIIGTENARALVRDLLTIVAICPLDDATLFTAANLDLTDFEDAVQVASALSSNLDAIVTRNGKDFAGSTISIMTPTEVLAHLTSER
jgi:predicted nucleic acid-binding protein